MDVVTVLTLALIVAMVLLPKRWAVGAFLLVVHLDPSGPGWASAVQVGAVNAVRVLVAPTVLVLRLGLPLIRGRRWRWMAVLGLSLMTWIIIAVLWSPRPLSGAKQIGYVYAYLATFGAFTAGWKSKLIDRQLIFIIAGIAVLLAVYQSWVAGNPFGGFDSRFTSFSSPQSFGQFMVGVAAIGLSSPKLRLSDAVRLTALSGVVVASGSRLALMGLVTAVVVYVAFRLAQPGRRRDRSLWVGKVAITAALGMAILAFSGLSPSSTRATETFALLTSETEVGEIETLAWRFRVYDAAIAEARELNLVETMFGRGTSSAGELALRAQLGYERRTVDSNRVLHNEYLRALYEWGVVGALLLVLFVLVLIMATWKSVRSMSLREAAPPFVFALPLLLATLAVENVLAGPLTPGGSMFVLLISNAVASDPNTRVVRGRPIHS